MKRLFDNFAGVLETPEAPLARLPYHVGIASRVFDRGIAILTDAFGLSWEPPLHAEALDFMTPSGPVRVEAAAAHSLGGPMRVEVCSGTLWPTQQDIEFHHYGYWSADVARDVSALVSRGWLLEVSAVDASGHPAQFAYLTKAGQARIELVDVSRQPAYCERVGTDVPIIA